jgi:hypothetical protein
MAVLFVLSLQSSVAATNETQLAGPGVWYSYTTEEAIPVAPSGGVYSLAVGLTNWTFPHQLTVLAGDCENFVCVAYDAYGVEPPLVEWLPQPDTTYYIVVQGYGEERGDFELSLFAVENVS